MRRAGEPRLRGFSPRCAFFVSIACGVALILAASATAAARGASTRPQCRRSWARARCLTAWPGPQARHSIRTYGSFRWCSCDRRHVHTSGALALQGHSQTRFLIVLSTGRFVTSSSSMSFDAPKSLFARVRRYGFRDGAVRRKVPAAIGSLGVTGSRQRRAVPAPARFVCATTNRSRGRSIRYHQVFHALVPFSSRPSVAPVSRRSTARVPARRTPGREHALGAARRGRIDLDARLGARTRSRAVKRSGCDWGTCARARGSQISHRASHVRGRGAAARRGVRAPDRVASARALIVKLVEGRAWFTVHTCRLAASVSGRDFAGRHEQRHGAPSGPDARARRVRARLRQRNISSQSSEGFRGSHAGQARARASAASTRPSHRRRGRVQRSQ